MPTGHHRKLRVKNHTLRGGVLPGADISSPYKMRYMRTLVRLMCKNNA